MIVGLVALVIAVLAWIRMERLEKEVKALRRTLLNLENRPPPSEARTQASPPATRSSPAAPPPAAASSGVPPAPALQTPSTESDAVRPAPSASAAAATPLPPSPATAPSIPSTSQVSPLANPPITPPPIPTPPIRTPRSRVPPARQLPARPLETLERHIGERLLLYLGMIVVLLGVAFFLRYAFEHQWVSPAVRVALGVAAGLGFFAGGRALRARDYMVYGLFVSGGGLAILFLSVYAAYAFYGLIGQLPAFVLLTATAVWAAHLADSEASLPLALLAVCAGYSTPFLVGGSSDAHVVLFSYDAALVAATRVLARRRNWPWLNLVSLGFVMATMAAWADVHYDPSLYLRIELFLTIFCVLFALAIWDTRQSTHGDAHMVGYFLLMAPLLYHGASIAVLSSSEAALLIYLTLMSATVVVASHVTAWPLVRLAGWVLIIGPFVVAAFGSSDFALWEVLASLAIWLIFSTPAIRLVKGAAGLRWPDIALVHKSAVGAFLGIYAARHDLSTSTALAWMATALAVANLAIWWPLRAAPEALHWVGAAATLAALAIAIGMEGWWGVVAWGIEAAALVWLGARLANGHVQRGGLALFGLAATVWVVRGVEPLFAFTTVLNDRTLSAGALVGALYVSAWMAGAVPDPARRAERALLLVGPSVLTVLAMTFEIRDYWADQRAAGADAILARELMLSAAWSVYGGLLVAVGMRYRYPPVRYFAIALFGLTIAKVFVVDLQQLDGIYRIVAFLAVGGVLLLASFLYQRSRKEEVGGSR